MIRTTITLTLVGLTCLSCLSFAAADSNETAKTATTVTDEKVKNETDKTKVASKPEDKTPTATIPDVIKPAPTIPDDKLADKTSSDTFIPTEAISEDLAVSFPIDI